MFQTQYNIYTEALSVLSRLGSWSNSIGKKGMQTRRSQIRAQYITAKYSTLLLRQYISIKTIL